jgi:hypothetical protein
MLNINCADDPGCSGHPIPSCHCLVGNLVSQEEVAKRRDFALSAGSSITIDCSAGEFIPAGSTGQRRAIIFFMLPQANATKKGSRE